MCFHSSMYLYSDLLISRFIQNLFKNSSTSPVIHNSSHISCFVYIIHMCLISDITALFMINYSLSNIIFFCSSSHLTISQAVYIHSGFFFRFLFIASTRSCIISISICFFSCFDVVMMML